MKKILLATAFAFCALPILRAETSPADEVKAAAKKLAEAENYAFKSTVEMGGGNGGGQGGQGGRFRPGPTEGKVQKDGLVWISSTRGENTSVTLLKGGKSVTKGQDGAWKTPEEAAAARGDGGGGGDQGGRGRGGFMGRMWQNFKTPAAQAEEIVSKVKELKKADDAITGDLPEDAAKDLLSFGGRGPRRDGGEQRQGPEISGAKGTVKFWMKEGALAKMEVKLSGSINFNGEDRAMDRTTTTEISGVGASKIDAPEEAVKKLEAAAAAPKVVAPEAKPEAK